MYVICALVAKEEGIQGVGSDFCKWMTGKSIVISPDVASFWELLQVIGKHIITQSKGISNRAAVLVVGLQSKLWVS